MDALPAVTQAEFNAIHCNRCGDCCERFYLPSPAKLRALQRLTRAGGFITPEDVLTANWFDHVHPTGKRSTTDRARWQYRCDYFVRDDADHGTCTAYDKRPYACSGFPYSAPVGPEFPRCSWRVTIRPDDIPLEVVS